MNSLLWNGVKRKQLHLRTTMQCNRTLTFLLTATVPYSANFRGRKHSQISRFWATRESFLHEKWVCPYQPIMIGFSILRKFSPQNGHFLPSLWKLSPSKVSCYTVYAPQSIMQHYYIVPRIFTIFPRNLTVARFYFQALFGAAIIQGRLDFEGSVYRNRHARVHTASIISLFVCIYNACAYTCKSCWPFTMQQDFEGGIYWDELAETCGDISRAVGFWDVARFRGSMVFALCFEIMV